MEHKTKPFIIDFAGRSGSGKTYVKNEVLKHLSSDYRCFDLSDYEVPLHDYFVFILTAPKSFIASLYLIFFHIPRDLKHMFTLLKKWLIVQIKIKKARTLDYNFILSDEGFFKWFAIIRRLSLKKLVFAKIPDSVKKNFFYPDLTISVEADFDTVQNRRKIRGLPPRKKRKTPAKFKEYQENVRKDLFCAEKMELTRAIFYNNNEKFDVSLINAVRDYANGLK
ncbi:MAG: hypothetical protein JW957_05605 [Candidatus Omnitrophica bacterium]|nr:hypothetical protein [Candidatus Omnitrophota bacterium]